MGELEDTIQYHTAQLSPLLNDGTIKIKLTSDNHETNWLDINPECCLNLHLFLDELEKGLK